MTDPQSTQGISSPAYPEDDLANDVPANEAHAAEMKRKMQGDVAAWVASRADASSPPLVAPRPAARQSAPIDPAKPAAAKSPKAGAAVKSDASVMSSPLAATQARKPFSMSYDGRPPGMYAAERFDRGAR